MSAVIRVLHLLEDHDTIGGAEEVVSTLLPALRDSGRIESEVALIAPNRLASRLRERGIIVHSLGDSRAVRPSLAAELSQIVITGKFQIVQSHLLKINTLNALASSRHSAKTVGTCHGLLSHELTFRSRLYGFWAGRKLDQTVCVSHALAKQYRQAYFVPSSKVTVIPNAYDPARLRIVSDDERASFRYKHSISSGDNLIVAIGNIAPVKGFGELIEAIGIVAADKPKLSPRLLIAGSMREPETSLLREIASDCQIADRVGFLGEFRDISLLFSAALLYVSSSRQEGFSLTTVEAMASGVPVIVTDSGGPAEIVDQGRCGRVVPIRDRGALAFAIIDMLENRAESHAFATEAKKRVAAEYTPEKMTSRYLELYESLLNRK